MRPAPKNHRNLVGTGPRHDEIGGRDRCWRSGKPSWIPQKHPISIKDAWSMPGLFDCPQKAPGVPGKGPSKVLPRRRGQIGRILRRCKAHFTSYAKHPSDFQGVAINSPSVHRPSDIDKKEPSTANNKPTQVTKPDEPPTVSAKVLHEI